MAAERHRRSRRLAARHADRRHGSFVSRAALRMEIFVLAGHRVRFGIADRHERLQGAAGALGQRIDADGEEDSAESVCVGRAVVREGGSVFSPDGEHQLSADGVAVHDAAACNDRAVLPGLAADDLDRFAVVPRFDLLDFEFLPGGGHFCICRLSWRLELEFRCAMHRR